MPPLLNLLRRRQARADTQADPSIQASGRLLERVLKELRSNRRATVFRTLVILPFALYAAAALYFLVGPQLKDEAGDAGRPRLGVVRVEGVISATSKANASSIVEQLRRAFESKEVHAVVLAIDSPGGSPVEAERIATAIELFKSKHPKPVYSLIGNLGASAAYMVALNGEKIYSHRYSLVGSIGAVIQAWNVKELADRIGVKQTAYASGPLKAMLNPFAEPTPDGKAKAQSLVQQAGAAFLAEVKAKRDGLLNPRVRYDTGELWRGEEAVKLGLTDGFATLESLSESLKLTPLEMGPRRRPFAGLAAPSLQSISDAVAKAVVQQLAHPGELQQY